MPPRPPGPRAHAGFTLVEVLVALLVMSLIAGMAWQGIAGMVRTRDASQRRLEPFWHVAAQARYVYDRRRDYTVPASGPEVREVTVLGQDYPINEAAGRGFALPVLEHCREEFGAQLRDFALLCAMPQ